MALERTVCGQRTEEYAREVVCLGNFYQTVRRHIAEASTLYILFLVQSQQICSHQSN
jgi:hypothetical protein